MEAGFCLGEMSERSGRNQADVIQNDEGHFYIHNCDNIQRRVLDQDFGVSTRTRLGGTRRLVATRKAMLVGKA